jgi:hypothetical protein
MADQFPQADEAYNTFMNQFVPYVAAHAAQVGVHPRSDKYSGCAKKQFLINSR